MEAKGGFVFLLRFFHCSRVWGGVGNAEILMKNGKNSKWENKNKMKKVIINNKKSEEK